MICILFSIALFPGTLAEDDTYTIMKPDLETLMKWVKLYENSPRFSIAKDTKTIRGSKSLLSHLNYIPEERDQGSCGSCWIWATTGCMEISLDVEEGIFDRLSTQYMNSCMDQNIYRFCCEGGSSHYVVSFYSKNRKAIPWSNLNAFYQDGDNSCDTSCSFIETIPNYPIKYIEAKTIETHGVGNDKAISNIKTALDQNIPVYFAFYLPTSAFWNSFFKFWFYNQENIVWNYPEGAEDSHWKDGGGHAVLCVGYNDVNPENSYWILVNSWGTAGNLRPNGIFRMNMNTNYDYKIKTSEGDIYSLYWQIMDIDWDIVHPTPTPTSKPGDSCLEPIDAFSNFEYTGSTLNYQNNYDPSYTITWPYFWVMQGPDCVFKINLNPVFKSHILARVSSADFDNALYIISDCDNPGESLLGVQDQYSNNTGEELSCTVNGKSEVYVILDSYHVQEAGTFTIQIEMTEDQSPTPTITPTPTPTITPTPTPDLMPEEYVYNFDSGEEGWKRSFVSEIYDEPNFIIETGKIGFSPGGSANCYGFWESPYHRFIVGQTYRARVFIQTDQPDQSLVPTIRIRVQDQDSQLINIQMINSQGEGNNSPLPSGTTYEILYQPSKTSHTDRYSISIDLINIGSVDDSSAKIHIDRVEIKKIDIIEP